ncbi:MAG: YheU family protein [Bdellovibrionales bacterium]|nr:YheU family protein [Bdellovibrionales bacterium]
MIVPYQDLSDDVLRGVIEAFVLEEGTDYGQSDFSLDAKVEQVRKQLQLGKAQIAYDPIEETCTIVRSPNLS